MDGRHFFRQAVQELYEKPFPGRSGPRISASKAAKLARHERGKKRDQETDMQVDISQSGGKAPSKEVEQQSPPGRFADHFIMNLPASAIDMLDAFDSLYTPLVTGSEEQRIAFMRDLEVYSKRKSKGEWDGELRLPMVHCYCFTKEVDDFEPDICKVGL
jgi:tRNA (guanine37-N1)-methyltransferase